MDKETQDKLYAEAMGEEALVRQKRLADERYVCCGVPKAAGHAPGCWHWKEPGSRQAGR